MLCQSVQVVSMATLPLKVTEIPTYRTELKEREKQRDKQKTKAYTTPRNRGKCENKLLSDLKLYISTLCFCGFTHYFFVILYNENKSLR